MTRINMVVPTELMDQHLIAELKEINQLAGQFRNSLKSKRGIVLNEIPEQFTLNTGHVRYFYSRGKYLHNRFELLKIEARRRGFNIQISFNNEWIKNNRVDLYNDWTPTERDYNIIRKRIREKIDLKPNWYKYYKKPIPEGLIDKFYPL